MNLFEDQDYESSSEDFSSEISSSEEKLLLNRNNIILEEVKVPSAWDDSEENETDLREEYLTNNNVIWQNNKKNTMKSVKKTEIRYKFTRNILSANNTIKFGKIYNGTIENKILVFVTTMNDIIIYLNYECENQIKKSINLSFSIESFEFIDDEKILLINKKCGILKELNIETMNFNDIKIGANKICRKIEVNEQIFILEERLEILDKRNYECIKTLNLPADDFCLTDSFIVILGKDKSLYLLSRNDYRLVAKKKISDKYFITKLFSDGSLIFVALNRGIIVFDETMTVIKEFFDIKIDNFAYNKNFYFFSGDQNNSLRVIVRKGLKVFSKLHTAGLTFPRIKSLFVDENNLFFSNSSSLSKIQFYYQ